MSFSPSVSPLSLPVVSVISISRRLWTAPKEEFPREDGHLYTVVSCTVMYRISNTKHTKYQYHNSSYVSPERVADFSPCFFCCRDILGRHLHLFPGSLIFPIASITLLGILAILRPSSPIPHHVPCLPSLGAGPQHDATASLGRRVLSLWLLVTRWRRPPAHVF